MTAIEKVIRDAVEKGCEVCPNVIRRDPKLSTAQWERKRFCSFRCGGVVAARRQGFRKGNLPANKGKKTIRQCSECSERTERVCFYIQWNRLLCEKHYYHYRRHGHALWGDRRPYRTPVERRQRRLKGVGLAWRKAVFERDDYTCQMCGIRGTQLNADHIKPFRFFPALRWELANGRTLCVPCHRKTPTYGRRLDHLAEGRDAESFFSSLTTGV
jgi:5-methylcytosine-specific restriction endonuclease McrA